MKLKYYIPAMVNLNSQKMFKPPKGYLTIRPARDRDAYECWFLPAVPFIYIYEFFQKVGVAIQIIGLYHKYVTQKKAKTIRK